MQNLRQTIHYFSVDTWGWNANEEDGDLSDLCEDQEYLSDLCS